MYKLLNDVSEPVSYDSQPNDRNVFFLFLRRVGLFKENVKYVVAKRYFLPL